MKHKKWLVGFVAIGVIITYIIYQDYLPPQTPQKRARLISELEIPHNAKVIVYQDNDIAPISDWRLLVTLELEKDDYEKLATHLTNEWKPLNKDVWRHLHINKKFLFLNSDAGFYRISELEKSSFGDLTGLTISILSPTDRRVAVYSYSL